MVTVLPDPTEQILTNKLNIDFEKILTLSGKYKYVRFGVGHPIREFNGFCEPNGRLAMPFHGSLSQGGHVIVIRKPIQ